MATVTRTARTGPSDIKADLAFVLPEGTAAPVDIPPEIFRLATETHLQPRRLDMQALAAELGIGRTTLYRRVGDRDRLLGAVVWYFGRAFVTQAVRAAGPATGRARVVAVIRHFMTSLHDQPPHRRFLEEEPGAAMRILTSKDGPVQHGILQVIERLLALEEERGNLQLSIPRESLAYALVRLVESFLYADVMADVVPDIDQAARIVEALLTGTDRTPDKRAQDHRASA